jgi:hypothetical protein
MVTKFKIKVFDNSLPPILLHKGFDNYRSNMVDASYNGLLWQNGVFSLGTFYSNAYGDKYILRFINWDSDLN